MAGLNTGTSREWMANAACRNHDPELFFPDKDDPTNDVDRARAICRHCTVQADCLTYALAWPDQHGIAAGLTPTQRVRLRNHANTAA